MFKQALVSDLAGARHVIEAWRRESNEERTYNISRDMTPVEFIHNHQDRTQAAQKLTSLAVV